MKNRITHVWDAIEDEAVRNRVRKAEEDRSGAAYDAMKSGSPLRFRTLHSQHPVHPEVLVSVLILFVGGVPALILGTERK